MNKSDNLLPANDTHRRIIHVDMDAFYAAVEMRDHPEYRHRPLVVGQDPRQHYGHGVVATANYLARTFGIHSAMPSVQALHLAPQQNLIFIKPNFAKYRAASRQIHAIMHEYTDLVQSVALDEAYLDVTRNKKQIASATEIALAIQERIYHELGLTCSFGVTYNKFLAKMGSEYAKPFGRTIILPNEALAFLGKKKIGDFPGIGPKTQTKLEGMGIFTGHDLQKVPVRLLVQTLGKMGYLLAEHAHGIDLSAVIADSDQNRKSIGIERTYEPPIQDEGRALALISAYCRTLVAKLRQYGFLAKTVVLKVRQPDFRTITKRQQLSVASTDLTSITQLAQKLFQKIGRDHHLEEGIRLLGVSVTDFVRPDYQETTLF